MQDSPFNSTWTKVGNPHTAPAHTLLPPHTTPAHTLLPHHNALAYTLLPPTSPRPHPVTPTPCCPPTIESSMTTHRSAGSPSLSLAML